jgi:hypothetical protein
MAVGLICRLADPAVISRVGGAASGEFEERDVKAVLLVAAMAMLIAGCSDDKPAPAASGASSDDILKRNCNDPKWREQNLGLWYSVCRQPVRW